MHIIKSFPPNFKAIATRFPVKGKPGILYAYGNTLYNPSGVPVEPWIKAHEAIHMSRQEAYGVDRWWNDYINNDQMRLYEELLAHRAEYLSYEEWFPNNPKRLAKYLETVLVPRLSSPLYGSLISPANARRLIGDQ